MVSSNVAQALSKLEDSSTSDRPTGYRDLLQQIKASSNPSELPSNLAAFIDSILSESLSIVAARPLLGSAVEAISSLPSTEDKISVGTQALQTLAARVVSFEEQDAMIREIMADAYQEQEDFIEAAKMLQGIQLESSQRKISDDSKVRTWIRICRLYIEEDDTTTAESFLNRAKNLLYKVEDPELNLTFALSQARILDSRRRFLDASSAYHSVSFTTSLAEEERLHTLSAAITCAVLAPAGPARSRSLAKLYKDERAAQVAEFGILEKMFLDRLLSKEEVDKFAANLMPHQLAKTADGSTVLAKAVVEHNLLSASRLYNNIGVKELGGLLDLDAEKAEQYAAQMLEQGRLTGRIDQIDGVIFFDGIEGSGEKIAAGKGNKVVGHDLRKWDSKVQGLSEEVERVASMLQAEYPEFAAAAMVH
ncbi:COP9 signalosome complex subunit 4, partial [Lecanoromycetidae sp. Uapishka_2]